MRKGYKKLGEYIQPVNIRNKDLEVKLLLGVSITKKLIPSIANTIGSNMANYKIIERNQFAYGPVTSRNGEKISVGLLDEADKAIISQSYTVFEIIDTNKLLPIYLMMWFSRPEFDRYARYHSHGSTRETFSWEEMCDVELPIPSIEKQREIVAEYQAVENKIKTNEQICEKLEATAQALYKHWFIDFEFPNSPPLEGCPKDGVVSKHPKNSIIPPQTKDRVVARNTKNYMSLPYNPKLKDRARKLRKAGNLAEVLFWKQVRNKQFLGLDFDRQKIIGNYIVDFYNANHQLVIEIDGSSHDDKEEYDAKRQAYLEGLGLTVVRFTDVEVKKQIDAVMRYLEDYVEKLEMKYLERNEGMLEKEKNHPERSATVVKEGKNRPNGSRKVLEQEKNHPERSATVGKEGKNHPERSATVVEEGKNHPAFQAPLQRRGIIGYKSSGGAMVWNEEMEKEIPEGWEVGTLSKICKYSNRRIPVNKIDTDNYVSTENLLPNKLGVTSASSLPSVINVTRYEIGNVLISNIRPYFKKIWLASSSGGCSNDVLCFVAKTDIPPLYLYQTLERDIFFEYVMAGSKGTKMPRGDKNWIMNYPIIIPSTKELNNFSQVIRTTQGDIELRKKQNQKLILFQSLLLARMAKEMKNKN